MGIESSSQDQHRYRHDERPDTHQRTASELIHRENSQYGKRQVQSRYGLLDLWRDGYIGGVVHLEICPRDERKDAGGDGRLLETVTKPETR